MGKFVRRALLNAITLVAVERLANNIAFQRFAVRTSMRIADLSKIITAKAHKVVAEKVKEGLKNMESHKDT